MQKIEPMNERAARLRQMNVTLRVSVMAALADHRLGGSELRAAVANCTSCKNADACEAWLERSSETGPTSTPPFCRNAALLRTIREN